MCLILNLYLDSFFLSINTLLETERLHFINKSGGGGGGGGEEEHKSKFSLEIFMKAILTTDHTFNLGTFPLRLIK